MQTLWWLPNEILRHIHKKRFSVFLSCFLRICNQSLQKVLVRAKQDFSLKNSIWVSKNAEFHADFESIKKVLKKCTIKLLAKMWRKKALFHFLLMFVKLFLLITFFWCIFLQLFQRIRNQREILRFLVSFQIFFKNFFFWVILVLFGNFEAKRAKNGSKNQKTYLVNVS